MTAIVWLEGLIGSGKTTLAQSLAKEFGYREILEPVAHNSYLDLFYGDQKRWAFSFQMDMLFRRWELHQLATFEALSGRGVILDRGMPGDMVFAEMHLNAGNIHPLEWRTYQRMYRSLMTQVSMLPRVLVFLDVAPEIALQRVRRRDRIAESGMTLDYLQKLRQMYLKLLDCLGRGVHDWAIGLKVLKVDWNHDGMAIGSVIQAIRHAIPS